MNLGDLKSVSIILGVAIIVVALVSQITGGVRDSSPWNKSSYINESVTTDAEGVGVVSNTGDGGVDSLDACWNGSTELTVGTECNLTHPSNGTITTTVTSGSVLVSYTSLFESASREIANLGLEGMKTMASWFPIIAIVVVATIIIGLLGSAFKRRT